MSHGDATIDAQPFDLKEHWVVCRIRRVATKDPARRNHAHRRATALHRVNLHGRCLRTQSESLSCVEGVLRIACRMARGNIQRVEVVEVSFDLAIIFDDIAERHEDVFDPLAHQSYWMEMSGARTPPRNRNVETIAGCARGFNYRIQFLFGGFD